MVKHGAGAKYFNKVAPGLKPSSTGSIPAWSTKTPLKELFNMTTPYISYMRDNLCNVVLHIKPDKSNRIMYFTPDLTTTQKRKVLKELRKSIIEGDVDKPMIPYLNKINSIPGICSQFCCMGHRKELKTGANTTGNLIVFVGIDMNKHLQECWPQIAAWNECVKVATGRMGHNTRWLFDWKMTHHKSYYREFLDKLIPLLRQVKSK